MTEEYVVVTTDKDKRGVFSGYLVEDKQPDYVVLKDARMIVYWPEAQRGVVSLAAVGPVEGCRISYSAPKMKITGVTAIFSASQDAVKEFERNKWS